MKRYIYPNYYICNKLNAIYKSNDRSMLVTDAQRTQVFQLYVILTGEKIVHKSIHTEIYEFFKTFAKTGKKHRWLNNVVFSDIHERRNNRRILNHKLKYRTKKNNLYSPCPTRYSDALERQHALELARKFITNEISDYSKIPFFGINHLYFCHPNYAHHDYNKIETCNLNTNYKFCKKLCEICKKSFKKRTGVDYDYNP